MNHRPEQNRAQKMNFAMSLAGLASAALLFVSMAPATNAAPVSTFSFSSTGSAFKAKSGASRNLLSSSLRESKVSKKSKKKKRGGGVRGSSIVKPVGGVLGSTGTPGGPTVKIGVGTAEFTETIGGDGVVRTSTGNVANVTFGGAQSESKSYLQFMGADPVNFALPLNGTVDFAIANLYHFNGQVAEGTGIFGAKLAFTLTIGSSALPLILDLSHNDRNGPAADQVQILNPATAVALPPGALGPSSQAVLSILGFSRTTTELLKLTEEGNTGAFTIFGRLTVTPVPVPAALPLFATGVAALAFAARRRRQPQA
jgi:hypothetical protein